MSGRRRATPSGAHAPAHTTAYRAACAAAIVLFILPAQGVWAFGIRERQERERENERFEQPGESEPADTSSDGERQPDVPREPEPEPGDGTEDNAQNGDDAPDDAADDTPDDDADDAADEPNGDVITFDDFAIRIERPPIAFDNPRDARTLAVQIEADRRLLNELRKQIPDERIDAELFLKRIRELAAISDPVYLVPIANNVLRQAPLLFEWLETEYEDPDERIRDYYIGGSWAFHRRYEAFRNAVLITVIRRLDAVGDYLMEQNDGRRR